MQPTDTGSDRFLKLAREAFTDSTSYFDASIRRQQEANIRQFQGVHPANSKYHSDAYKTRSRLFRPKTRSTVRKNEAAAAEAFFSTNDVVSIEADDPSDEMQAAGAELMNALMNYRLKVSIPWFLTCIGAYQDANVAGVCISHQWWEYNEKRGIDRPRVDLLPVENFRFHPGANWTDPVNSSPYNILLIPMYVKDVLAKMNTIDPKTNQPKWKRLPPEAILTAMNQYGDSTRLTRERGRTDPKEQNQAIREFAVVWVHLNVIDVDGEDKVYYTLGTHAMLSEPLPLKEVYRHGIRPFAIGYCALETHKNYPAGPVEMTSAVQAEINAVTNQRMDNVSFAMNKRYFAKRGAQVDLRSLTRNVPGSVTLMNDPEKDVEVHSTPDVTASSYQEQDRLNLDFDDVAGAFSPSSINSNRRLNETVGGLELLDASSNQVGSYQLRTFVETWMENVLAQLVALEQAYETDLAILVKAGRDAGIKAAGMEQLNSMLMQQLTLEVNVGNGSTNPQTRLNNFLAAMKNLRELLVDGLLERYGLDIGEVIKELFGKLGYKNGGRFFKKSDDPRLLSAMATIEQLQGELAQKVSPELVAAQVRKIDAEIEKIGATVEEALAKATSTLVNAQFAAVQTAEVIAAVPQVSPVADQVLANAGFTGKGAPDPNLPVPTEAAPGLVVNPVKDPRTGMEFTPGDGTAAAGDTSPNTPTSPASALEGANQGIETMAADS